MALEDEMLKVKGPTSGEGLSACVWSVAVRQDKKRECVHVYERKEAGLTFSGTPSQEYHPIAAVITFMCSGGTSPGDFTS